MAEENHIVEGVQQYIFKKVHLFKKETLGTGSYGAVCKAKCDQLICAAKLLYPVLFQMQSSDPGKEHRQPFRRFEQECQFLSRINHPSIVQYLGTYRDPETNAPVLLMELMDESLTHFLESTPGDIPYHIQVNIAMDIAQAIAFLHSNGIIHRDLSSNNVLLIAGSRAKVSDFGMSKFTDLSASLTTCPGTPVFMSPEALDYPPAYTEKLDNFSFGVLLIQIVTRKFPSPSERFETEQIPDRRNPNRMIEARVPIPEVERRQAHISLIEPTHPLLPIALGCLKDESIERPSSQDLCQLLYNVKKTQEYEVSSQRDLVALIGSKEHQIEEMAQLLQIRDVTIRSYAEKLESREENVHQLKESLLLSTQKNEALENEKEAQQDKICDMKLLLLAKEEIVQANLEEIQQLKEALYKSDEETMLQSKNIDPEKQLATLGQEKSPSPTSQLQSSKTFERTASDPDSVHSLENGHSPARDCSPAAAQYLDRCHSPNPHLIDSRSPAIAHYSYRSRSPVITHRLDRAHSPSRPHYIERGHRLVRHCQSDGGGSSQGRQLELKYRNYMQWKTLTFSSDNLHAGSSAVIEDAAFFTSGTKMVHKLDFSKGEWSALPDCPLTDYTIVAVDNVLTTVGGVLKNWREDPKNSNKLFCFSKKKWVESFPPMSICRSSPGAVYSNRHLIVVGGFNLADGTLTTVEILDTVDSQWLSVSSLPFKASHLSVAIFKEFVYLHAWYTSSELESKSVIKCSVSDLLQSYPISASWEQIAPLEISKSSLVVANGHLLAVGGETSDGNCTELVHQYDTDYNRWEAVGLMCNARCKCLTALLPGNKLVVVGGGSEEEIEIEMATFKNRLSTAF